MSEPVWIRQDVVLAMHEEALMLHGGAEGVRDLGLLEYALARPKNLFAYSEQAPSLARFAASYAKEIVANHPFVDGNKRTALATCLVFLSENNLLPDEKLDVDAWEALTLDVAASRLDRAQTTKRLRKLLRSSK